MKYIATILFVFAFKGLFAQNHVSKAYVSESINVFSRDANPYILYFRSNSDETLDSFQINKPLFKVCDYGGRLLFELEDHIIWEYEKELNRIIQLDLDSAEFECVRYRLVNSCKG